MLSLSLQLPCAHWPPSNTLARQQQPIECVYSMWLVKDLSRDL